MQSVKAGLELLKGFRIEVALTETYHVKRIDNSGGNVGHNLSLLSMTGQKARRAERELVLGLRGSAPEVELGKHLGEPAVEENSGGQPGRIVHRSTPP